MNTETVRAKPPKKLAAGLKREMMRNIHLLATYRCLHGGVYKWVSIQRDLEEAVDAMLEPDVVAMMRVYQKLKSNNG